MTLNIKFVLSSTAIGSFDKRNSMHPYIIYWEFVSPGWTLDVRYTNFLYLGSLISSSKWFLYGIWSASYSFLTIRVDPKADTTLLFSFSFSFSFSFLGSFFTSLSDIISFSWAISSSV